MFDARNFYNISIINCNLSNNRFGGVDARYFENLYVKNCIIQEGQCGIHLSGMKNVSIINCKIKDNLYYGIDIKVNYGKVLIKNCSIVGIKNLSGINILNKKSGRIYIEECNIKNNPCGIEISVSYGSNINYPGGIYIHRCNIYGNKIGIYATSFSIVDARYNYWGSKFGQAIYLG